jgi:hypothetical protein
MLKKGTERIKIGDEYFRAGIMEDMVKAADHLRLLDRDKYDWLPIVGYPAHWAYAVWQQELFKGPEVRILQARLEGTGLVGREGFDLNKALEAVKTKDGVDLTAYRNAIKMPGKYPATPIRKTLPIRVQYDVSDYPPSVPGISMEKLYHLVTLRQLRDGVVRYIHAKGHPEGPFFLWRFHPQHKYAGKWNAWGEIIKDNLKVAYKRPLLRRPTAIGCLDILAVHEKEDWWMHKKTILEAAENARNPDYIRKELEPLLIHKKAEGLMWERSEPKKAPPTEVKVKKLFVPVNEKKEEKKEGE